MNPFVVQLDLDNAASQLNGVLGSNDPLCLEARKLLFPNKTVVGVADFFHVNPSMPNRELSGLLRLNALNEALGPGYGEGIVSLVYDCVLPISEARGEGGGYGFKFGIHKKTVPILGHPERAYYAQKALALDQEKVLAVLLAGLCRRIDISRARAELFLRNRLKLLEPFFKESDGDAAEHLMAAKRRVYKNLLHLDLNEWYLLSGKYREMAKVLALALDHGLDVFSVPLGNANQYLFRYINETGRIEGQISKHNGQLLLKRSDRQQSLSRDQVLKLLIDKRLVPSFEIYFLVFVLIPGWSHFGNLYDRFQPLCQWYAVASGQHRPLFYRFGKDGQNSIPLGGVFLRGTHRSALLSHDIFIYQTSEIRAQALATAKSGKPAVHDVRGFMPRLRNHLASLDL